MLVIRQAQLESIGRTLCEARLVENATADWPAECAAAGQERLRTLIHGVVVRCSAYELVTEREVRRYLNVVFALGFGFEDCPRYAWARPILEDRSLAPAARVDKLCALVKHALSQRPEDGGGSL